MAREFSRRENIILRLIAEQKVLSGPDIQRRSGMWVGTMYPVLYRLERQGYLRAEWVPGPWPRTRIYMIGKQT